MCKSARGVCAPVFLLSQCSCSLPAGKYIATFEPAAKFENWLQSENHAESFKPPGELLASYQIKNRRFEVWHARLTDLAVQQILKRMQIFIPFFIEGGTYINLDDAEWTLQRWRVFFLYVPPRVLLPISHTRVSLRPDFFLLLFSRYEKLSRPPTPNASVYSIVGYCTVYRYYLYTPTSTTSSSSSPADRKSKRKAPSGDIPFEVAETGGPSPITFPSRERISQFLVLPPYQHRGHGSAFYNALMDCFLSDPSVHEVTVEDPNEAFDDLRDYCDLARLRRDYPAFSALRINTSAKLPKHGGGGGGGPLPTAELLPLPTLEALRRESKIAPRQFARLVEMQLLSLIPRRYLQLSLSDRQRLGRSSSSTSSSTTPHNDERAYYLWRLLVKQRLYTRNKEQLHDLDPDDRTTRLEGTLNDLEADYARLLQSATANEDIPPLVIVDDADDDAKASKTRERKRPASSLLLVDSDPDDNDHAKKAQGEDEPSSTSRSSSRHAGNPAVKKVRL